MSYYIDAENVWAKDMKAGDKLYVPGVSAGLAIPGVKDTRQVSLSVHAPQSARVQLRSVADDDRRSYDIIIGENDNTQSRIRRCDTNGLCDDCVIYPIPPKNGALSFDFRTSKMYESNSSNCDPTRADDACGAWRSNAFEPPVLSVGDFGGLDALGSKNCDDVTSDATCEATAWAGPRKDAYLEMEMSDKLTFAISSIEIPLASAPSRAFQYTLEETNLVYHVDFDKDELVENVAGGFQVANRAPGVSTDLQNLKIHGGSRSSMVGNQGSLITEAQTSDDGSGGGGGSILMEFGVKNKGSTPYNRRDRASTTSKFLQTYGDEWQVLDESRSGGRLYSGPASWSVACGRGECAIRQRSNIHAWCKDSADCSSSGKKYNWRQPEALGTTLMYKGSGSTSWKDYRFQYKARSLDNDWIGVTFRQTDKNNFYSFEMGQEISARRLKKSVNGVITVLDEVHPSGCKHSSECTKNRWSHWGCSPRACYSNDNQASYVKGMFYHVEIRLDGNNIQVWTATCGNKWHHTCGAMKMLFDVDDSSLTKGTVGLTNRANHFGEYRQIQVTSNAPISGVGVMDPSKSLITGAQDMTLTSWIYKDATSTSSETR